MRQRMAELGGFVCGCDIQTIPRSLGEVISLHLIAQLPQNQVEDVYQVGLHRQVVDVSCASLAKQHIGCDVVGLVTNRCIDVLPLHPYHWSKRQ